MLLRQSVGLRAPRAPTAAPARRPLRSSPLLPHPTSKNTVVCHASATLARFAPATKQVREEERGETTDDVVGGFPACLHEPALLLSVSSSMRMRVHVRVHVSSMRVCARAWLCRVSMSLRAL